MASFRLWQTLADFGVRKSSTHAGAGS